MLIRYRQWERLLFSSPPPKPGPRDVLSRLTGELADHDLRIVTASVKLALTSRNPVTREDRRKLARERFDHLLQLKPFMTEEQLKTIAAAERAMKLL